MFFNERKIAPPDNCPYLEGRQFVQEYFFSNKVSPEEFEDLLSTGWRRFGWFFFRPKCPSCMECRPVRVLVDDFKPSKSQRRIMRKNEDSEVSFDYLLLSTSSDMFKIYEDHSINRFGVEPSESTFLTTFYYQAVTTFTIELYFNGELGAGGFCDTSNISLSTVYFMFMDKFKNRSPGTLSVIREIEQARDMGLKYYYLGYYIKDNQSMAYKNKFKPCECYDWETGLWKPLEE